MTSKNNNNNSMPLVDNNNKGRLIKIGKEIGRGSCRGAYSCSFYNDDANKSSEEKLQWLQKEH